MRRLALPAVVLAALAFAVWLSPIAPLSFSPDGSRAQVVCGPMPNNFVNGTLADATKVNANFSTLISCLTANPILPHLANNTALSAPASTTFSIVVRDGFTVAGDAPPLTFVASGSSCPLNAGAGDGGSQVPKSGGGCWLAVFPTFGADVREFGAKCDGSTDDSAALQSWLNSGTTTPLGGGTYTCTFATPLVLASASNLSINGPNPYDFVLKYTGASTTADNITIGNASTDSIGITITGLRCASGTQMTSGACFHLKRVSFARLNNIIADGQEGNGTVYNGFWFDNAQQIILSNFMASGTNDAIRMNGGTYCDDIIISNGKASPSNGASDVAGVHIGGGCGGITLGDGAVLAANSVNLLIDTALNASGNAQIFQTPGAIIDVTSATCCAGTDGVQINDALAVGGTIELLGWIESATRYGINVINWNGSITVNTPHLGNTRSPCLFVQTTTPSIILSDLTYLNGCGGVTGAALDASLAAGNVISHANFGINANGNVGINLATSAIDYTMPWTPAVTCGSGSLTYTVNSSRAIAVGKRVTYNVQVLINTVTACASYLQVTLPFTTSGTSQSSCIEDLTTNKVLGGESTSGNANFIARLYDGTFAPAANWRITCNGFADHQ